MTFELYFDLTWNESRMLINESATEWEFDGSVMGSTNFINSMWLPDIQILNLKQFQKRQIVTDVAGLIIFKDKNVLYTVSTEAIISCPMKFSAYPLDHQVKTDDFYVFTSSFFPSTRKLCMYWVAKLTCFQAGRARSPWAGSRRRV